LGTGSKEEEASTRVSSTSEDQREVIAFLSNPLSYEDVEHVERLETHISLVFLAGRYAYKLKRAVRYPYLDFSTVKQRQAFCNAELILNCRTAPQLYLEVRSVARNADGHLDWGDSGNVVDWVVVMKRFEQDQRLDAMAQAGYLNLPLINALAAHVAEFHSRAAVRTGYGGREGLAGVIQENDTCLRDVALPAWQVKELHQHSENWLHGVASLLDLRRASGKVRQCHGDLHLRNICVLDGKPTLFDCIEFSEAFAAIDILYDLAFLLMDLEHQGHGASANALFNRYLDLSGEDQGIAAMPLFLSLRAAIRAHVAASSGSLTDAQSYLDYACRALQPTSARLVAIGGLSGTGKSTVAAALAPDLGARPGARVLRSDVIRKCVFGVLPEMRLPLEAYSSDVSDRVYSELHRLAATALRAGYCTIVDAVSLHPDERQAFAQVARDVGVRFTGIWLEAPAGTLATRVSARQNDASDATPDIVGLQLRVDPGPMTWCRVNAANTSNDTLAAVRRTLA
jgi:aminoglycoside phosphotransferase family enzyme/predicted kinase